jgi:hypothetical protein
MGGRIIMKNKKGLLILGLTLLFSLLVPLAAFASSFTFQYDFSSGTLYTDQQTFTGNDITIEMHNNSLDDTGRFPVTLQKCTKNFLGYCSWSDISTVNFLKNGISSYTWNDVAATGSYPVLRVKMQNGGDTSYGVQGFAQWRDEFGIQ